MTLIDEKSAIADAMPSPDLSTPLLAVALSDKHFQTISEIIFQQCGINLRRGKEELVKSRLLKRLRTLKLHSFDEYIALLKNDFSGAELTVMVDCMTTNKTNFFREEKHFDFLRTKIIPSLAARKLRIWSAGCSSGEEPYSLAILLHECLPDIEKWDIKILATDISTKVLAKAKEGRYSEEALADLPAGAVQKHFIAHGTRDERSFEAAPKLRKLITFARLNLMGDWPMKGPFDLILCRNVMIYFDKDIQQMLIERFRLLLPPGGHLFVGHSESMAGLKHGFTYVQPAVYRR